MPAAGSILGNGVFPSAFIICNGNTLCKLEIIYLAFTVVKGNTESATMRAIWDGVRQPAYEMKRIGKKRAVPELLMTGDGFMVTMAPDKFIKMANSKVVEFQLFDIEFTLKSEHLEALRKLGGMMQ